MDIYSAIHKAADHIEAHPEEFSFAAGKVPDGCGTPGCALGWISHFAGTDHNKFWSACKVMGLTWPGDLDVADRYTKREGEFQFYDRMDFCCGGNDSWRHDALECASALRLYAEHHHAPSTPDWNALATPDDNIREVTA